jgi:hypothetical protein
MPTHGRAKTNGSSEKITIVRAMSLIGGPAGLAASSPRRRRPQANGSYYHWVAAECGTRSRVLSEHYNDTTLSAGHARAAIRTLGTVISPSLTDAEHPAAESISSHTRDQSDRRGLFYRIIAADAGAPVLEFGAPFVRQWFTDVVSGDARGLASLVTQPAGFAMVILHRTLGGCASVADALQAAALVLEPGGTLALAAVNRIGVGIRPRTNEAAPRATSSGFRRAALRAGFAHVEVFVVRPDLEDPDYAVCTSRRSAHAFFDHEALSRKASGRDRWPLVRGALARLGLAVLLEPYLLLVAKR